MLYVSPLKAPSNDIQKNLQQPLAGIGNAALSAGLLMPELRVLVRTGDTPMTECQQMLKPSPYSRHHAGVIVYFIDGGEEPPTTAGRADSHRR